MTRILLLTLSLFTLPVLAKQDSLRYNMAGSNNWVPYYMADKATPGILGELIPLILVEAKIEGVQLNLPPKRTNQSLLEGELDFDTVCAEWFPNQDVGPEFVLSKPLFKVKEYFVGLQDSTKTAHLNHDNIGTVLGYYYYDDNLFNRIDFKSERELVLALKKARVSRILIGDLTASYWGKRYDVNLDFQKLHTEGLLRLRLNKQKQHLLPKLNAAIDALTERGVVARIVSKYTRLYSTNLNSD